METFVHWYNHEHRHCAIRFVTPAERHQGRDIEILAQRKIYEAAKQRHPQRWSGNTRNWQPIARVRPIPIGHAPLKRRKQRLRCQ
jgi:hypothetical protein